MFLKNQPKNNIEEYYNLLKTVGSLSNLFSESNIPYLYYRVAENIFCKAFDAKNLSRSDASADASKNSIGIGLKTFVDYNGKSLQKIAEFNKERNNYLDLLSQNKFKDFLKYISNLRNIRLEQTKVIHNLDELFYHCVAREKGKFLIYEEKMDLINIKKINTPKIKSNSLIFNDSINEYSFNLSKSTLYKRFKIVKPEVIDIDILNDPLETLRKLFQEYKLEFDVDNKEFEYVILPLFSTKFNDVAVNSGLNQWNANGRNRHPDEVYIPVPSIIHKTFPDFFPPNKKGVYFNLHLPNGKILTSSMCQDSYMTIDDIKVNKGKGLMSKPNKELGGWILRDILKIPSGTLVTYQMLVDLGIDSVEVRKIDNENYEIDFKKLNSYSDFIEQLQLN